MARKSKDAARIEELEALLAKKGVQVPEELEGEYKHDDGYIYAFKKGHSSKLSLNGNIKHKNEIIKDKELMTQLIESETKLIIVTGHHEAEVVEEEV
jgi:hypothetical protein